MTSSTAPQDGTTLTEVLAGYADAGFSGSFTALDAGEIECHSCQTVTAATAFAMSSLRRLEGASDPDDMMSVVAITCPACRAQGVLILGYGPNATAEDSAISSALRDHRDDDVLTGNSAPGEAHGDAPGATATSASTPLR